ncbi:hypothetical protein ONS95_013445 [Cadophora gregata]|uniref:uncharacterized protein n=1 Tax=Cadophora gregata TaxID=51156 RepID=UPI0026DD3DDA|nr:uncharacterized protein ONS95_013445 [Cadophora gregata]KAK0116426.1 hypothetical protein ONS95_013445 [Cadophora gregata]
MIVPARREPSAEASINERILSLVTSLSDRVKHLESKFDRDATLKRYVADGPVESFEEHGSSSTPLERAAKRARIHDSDERQSIQRIHEEISLTENDSTSGQNGSDAEVEDAATVLEFLAWGRLKESNLTSGIRNPSIVHDQGNHQEQDMLQNVQAWGKSPSSVSGGIVPIETMQVSQIQALLPTKMQVFLLFEYHADWLLFMHCSFHVPTFRKELDQFYDEDQGVISITSAGLQWAALLFAIICGSMTSVQPAEVLKWGFQQEEQSNLAKCWYQASIECLNAARYQQYHSLYSVQAIASSTISAHILGFSNSQSVLLASAVRIAQSLGLHRLGKYRRTARESQIDDVTEKVQKELGKRLWQQLATQDWFSVPFSETYCINPLHFTSKAPRHCDEDTMEAIPVSHPAITTYGNFLFRVAALMPALQDRSSEAHSMDVKYEHVLRFDKMMRDLVIAQLPPCLNSQTQVDPMWPHWVAVARRCLTITSAHKIIMIHRRFLGMSFHDKKFAFTRRTCLAAAKTIINEIKQEVPDESPILWTTQAFSVAAAIILALDNFSHHQSARESEEHRQLITETISILSKSVSISLIAARGTRLLTDLQAEERRHAQCNGGSSLPNDKGKASENLSLSNQSEKSLDVAAFVKKFCQSDHPPSGNSPLATSHMPLWLQQESSSQTYTESQRGRSHVSYPSFHPRAPRPSSSYEIPEPGYRFSPAIRRQHESFTDPFTQNISDSFDIRTVNVISPQAF